jgi:hypothetical protein
MAGRNTCCGALVSAESAAPARNGFAKVVTRVGLPEGTRQCEYTNLAECTDECDRGNAGSCKYLAGMYAKGKVVAKDLGKAEQLYAMACSKEDASACTDLATLIFNRGPSGAEEKTKAEGLRRKACDDGEPVACAFVAVDLRQKGNSDWKKIAALACEWGDAESCYRLAQETAEPEKKRLTQRGCALGFKDACGH